MKTPRQEIISKIEAGQLTLSASSFNAFMESPSHFMSYLLREKKQTDAMLFGILCHCMILEPDKFDERYLVMKDVALNTVEGKKEYALICSIAKGRTIIKDSVYRAALKCKATVLKNEPAYKLLMQCTQTEKFIQWEMGNHNWKGFIDGVGEEALIDLKKVQDASPSGVRRTIKSSGYHRQAYLYLYGTKSLYKKKFYIIAFDEEGGVSVHLLDYTLLDQAKREIDNHLNYYKECILMNYWNKNYDFYSPNEDGTFYIK